MPGLDDVTTTLPTTPSTVDRESDVKPILEDNQQPPMIQDDPKERFKEVATNVKDSQGLDEEWPLPATNNGSVKKSRLVLRKHKIRYVSQRKKLVLWGE